MKRVLFSSILVFGVSFTTIIFLYKKFNINIICSYKEIRSALFTGFLTIGGFLLSLKTFILIKLKEDLYDSPSYKERFENQKQLKPSLSYFEPLSNLSNFLIYCVLLSLITSLSQYTLGFIQSIYTIAFCIALSSTSFFLVIVVWWEIRANLTIWFELLDEENRN